MLLADVDSHLSWATEAFGGTAPDAVNLWIGDDRSATSYHKGDGHELMASRRTHGHLLLAGTYAHLAGQYT